MIRKQDTGDNTIVCAFSGGESSAYMAIKLKESGLNVAFVFANTGEENEETLEFAHKVDQEYGLNLVWLEADVSPIKGVGVNYKVVDYRSASRKGEPFENVIKKYGLPNVARPHCTRELKLSPINKWTKENVTAGSFRAIGIRTDEIDRVSTVETKYIYPLVNWWPTTKNEINTFWRDQPFRLNLKHYQGNCKVCYKKGFKKLAWIMRENPESFDFFARMEKEHPFTNCKDRNTPTRLFRMERTIQDIKDMAVGASEPLDDAQMYQVNKDLFGYADEDDQDACGSESCEAF